MAESVRSNFVDRHIGPTPSDQAEMLGALGYASLDALTDAAVPASIRRADAMDLPDAISEVEAIAALRRLADRNVVMTSLIGMGYSDTITPAVIRRNVLENPAWYTAYTPYQPEISQGRLEALLDFQTMVADLTGMDLANASLLDEATAAAEAMAMCRRLAPKGGEIFFVDADCHPQTIAVVEGSRRTARHRGDRRRSRARPSRRAGASACSCSTPGAAARCATSTGSSRVRTMQGALVAVASRSARAHAAAHAGRDRRRSRRRFRATVRGAARATAARTRRSSRCVTRTSARCPAGWSACRSTPHGRPALRLALQTREQHIRREKATSNICTAQVLLAVIAGLYAAYHGPEGLRAIATRACIGSRACSRVGSAMGEWRWSTPPGSTR